MDDKEIRELFSSLNARISKLENSNIVYGPITLPPKPLPIFTEKDKQIIKCNLDKIKIGYGEK